ARDMNEASFITGRESFRYDIVMSVSLSEEAMHLLEVLLILVFGAAGAALAGRILWERRLKHVVPKRDQIKIVNPAGFWPGVAEVVFQTRVLANRPWAGFFHLLIFYGFVTFSIKSLSHVIGGLGGFYLELPSVIEVLLNVVAVLVLASVVFMAIRRYTVMRDQLTHMLESGIVLALIGGLMITHLFEIPLLSAAHHDPEVLVGMVGYKINWWAHYLILCFFPALICYGKHLHLLVAPINVVLRHMTEAPSDRFISGGDLDMGDEDATEEDFERELKRVGMPNGVSDFSFHTLFDPAACIECGRCNDACPSRDAGLRPRDHFVLAFRDPASTSEQLAELAPPDIVSTCTQCRACDVVCPVGNRPSRAGLELRGRMTAEGIYPPRALKEGGAGPVTATGNIFAADTDVREQFIADNALPIYDAEEHSVLFILGCQGANSPEVQPVVVATARLLEAAGVKYGVLEEESCWGEGILHGGGLMEDWPFYKEERVMALSEAMAEKHKKTVLTICPHCRDNIGVQLSAAAEKMEQARFTDVRSHVSFLADLLRDGKIQIDKKAETVAAHHPCKTIHNDEQGRMDELLSAAGVTALTAGNSPDIPRCCGGGGGGFLWDSPAKVNKDRWKELSEETGQQKVVTACPGCHRMLNVAKSEEGQLIDIANVLYERLRTRKDTAKTEEEEPVAK
ncbi:MAG: Fe-S oxidoreductase, partial [Myxococcota bacterium]